MTGWREFYGNVSFIVGDGSTVNFWSHKWCGDCVKG